MISNLKMIPTTEIALDFTFNSRGKVAPIDVIDLMQDIDELRIKGQGIDGCGLLNPIEVSEENGLPNSKKYYLVAGFRRFVAFTSVTNPSPNIPALVQSNLSKVDKLSHNLIENLKRRDLNIYQEARALENFRLAGLTEEDVTKITGMSRGWVQVRYMLLALPKEIQNEAAEGTINQTHIRELYTIKDNNTRFEAVKALKDRKIKSLSIGKKPITARIKTNKSVKRNRSRPEILGLQEEIYEQVGNNIITRTLAWCAGEISDIELHSSIKDFIGEDYVIPTFTNL